MGLIFSLWVETETKTQEKAVKSYFEGRSILIGEKIYSVLVYDGGMVTVDGISRIGINTQEDAIEMTLIGKEFFNLLRKAPKFRYALVGLEVDEWRDINEIRRSPRDILKVPGFVIDKELYRVIGSPGKMEEFNSHYLWLPYEGEKWINKN